MSSTSIHPFKPSKDFSRAKKRPKRGLVGSIIDIIADLFGPRRKRGGAIAAPKRRTKPG
jgi:hypothetical protein